MKLYEVFHCQSILKSENRTEYMYHQKNDAVENQIHPEKSYNISLEWLFDMIVPNHSHTVTTTRIDTTIRHEKQ